MKCRNIHLLACVGMCFFFNEANAFIAGAKATAMGQTGVAYAQDAYAGVYNPAGSVDAGDRVDATFEWMHDHKKSTINGNVTPVAGISPASLPANPLINGQFNSEPRNFYNGDFAVNKCFCTNICGGNVQWSIGIAGYNSEFIKTRYKVANPLEGTSKGGMKFSRWTLSPFLAVSINSCHSVGFSIDYHQQWFSANGFENFDVVAPVRLTVYPGKVTNNGTDKSKGLTTTVGWRWKVTNCFTFGLTYRSRGEVNKFEKYKGFLSRHGKVDIPERWTLGLAYRFHPCVIVTGDLEWTDYRSVKAFHVSLLDDNGFFNQLGGKKSSVPNSTNGSAFGWKDQLIYRAGIEYEVCDCFTLRGGVMYQRRHFGPSQNEFNRFLMNIVETYATIGASWLVNPCNEISIFYAHGFEHQTKGNGSIPVNFPTLPADPNAGTSQALTTGGEVTLKQNRDVAGISWGFIF